MADRDSMLELLASIDRRLALLTAAQERDLRRVLGQDLLRTDARTAMFNSIDGQRGSPEIAKVVGVSPRAAQVFVKELLDKGLVRKTGGGIGLATIVERDDDAILSWYLTEAPSGPQGGAN